MVGSKEKKSQLWEGRNEKVNIQKRRRVIPVNAVAKVYSSEYLHQFSTTVTLRKVSNDMKGCKKNLQLDCRSTAVRDHIPHEALVSEVPTLGIRQGRLAPRLILAGQVGKYHIMIESTDKAIRVANDGKQSVRSMNNLW
ncbi:hypothetical protein MPTK1_1g28590 [Marchantia polymorpha subsp. ruderalis]|uniref:Uncharacterized protein n=2 Tax=Marchantia polymorpha TaxID=3197 RepID=A0AAF6AVA1_MARPO|nr:hypothetical protein MARPO_0002s0021 [Marchantia polymorpha]PTQ49512.1 hypothetical protein MARPO_0002s0021 [Marchantia polymorpha]BBN00371.1 hypothetical protein Mp_1g28590 [Marchantia polymorpha subsp. ruderalis]BBN00372.1 hypothetical protein Mp_1g28590 [Marchantia polymorpha subsp. ruderalis]|eukprot:PTQ49511.1 hypothetical protein MARPO_0002s0021 [Marchantia polymorpha]